MGILALLIELERIGCLELWRAKDKIVCLLDERGLTPKQVSARDRRVLRMLKANRDLLMARLYRGPAPDNCLKEAV